jgi:apolipoprotein N-acyltransferase
MRMRFPVVLIGSIFYALALPPFDWAPFGWLALVPLLLVVRSQPTGDAFRYGVVFGYVSGWAVTWCFAEAVARYFQVSLPIAVAGMSLSYLIVCGIPFGLFAAGSSLVLQSFRYRNAQILVPALWVACELVRGRILDQPWGLLGYTQHANVGLIQVATCAGVYGVSFLVAFGSTAMAEAICRLRAGAGRRSVLRALLLPAAMLAGCWALGIACAGRDQAGEGPERRVAIVQTNVAPSLHWTRGYTQAQLRAHVRGTNAVPATERPALIVWPENAVPRYLEVEPMLAVHLAQVAVSRKADLLFGGPRYEAGRSFNSARLIRADGRNGGHYDKRRLVLFAEEKPVGRRGMVDPNHTPEEFSPGNGPGVLQSFVALGISICHEITYPELITESVRAGAQLLVNIANDGWLDGGHEFAGRQHLAMAVLRAVETRRYVVRAATTGNSGVIDPYGRISAFLPPGRAGIVTAPVRGELALTPYARFGDLFAFACAGLAAGMLVRRRIRSAALRPTLIRAPAAS